MTLALLCEDGTKGRVVQRLLARVGISSRLFVTGGTVALVESLRDHFEGVLVAVDPGRDIAWLGGGTPARHLVLTPSLSAWLTCDPEANGRVLDVREVPDPARVNDWLESLKRPGGRRFSMSVEGVALADTLDLRCLAAMSPEFRAVASSLRPLWAGEQATKRGRGRPPGVALFHNTGYALSMELLHRGSRARFTLQELSDTLRRTGTPVLRLVKEAERRGYVRKAEHGVWSVRNAEHLLRDLVTEQRARRQADRTATLGWRVDRGIERWLEQLGARLGEHGVPFALTGAAAVRDLGGDHLIGGPRWAYALHRGLRDLLEGGYEDRHQPQIIFCEPLEEGVFHHMRPGPLPLVSEWQAVVDLLSSVDERDQETGRLVWRRLEERREASHSA